MARIFPKTGPQQTGSTTAEPNIYWRLSKQLSDEFTVIHSLPWLASVAQEIDGRSVPTGEIDFLVLHRDLGILAIEVKGGVFTCNRTEFVYKRTGQKIDPIRQVRRGVHALAAWLHDNDVGKWRIGYCFIFPDSDMKDKKVPIALIDSTVDPPQRIILDIHDIHNLGERIKEVMQYWQKSLNTWEISDQQLGELIDIILPSEDYTPCWQTRLSYDAVTWLRLTDEQITCLQRIEQRERLVITGFPGTGKTLLLIEHARKLSKQGKKVLVITYNVLLSKYLQDELSGLVPEVEVLNFHEQCRKACQIMGHEISSSDDWYSGKAHVSLMEAVNTNELPSYDALLIDEGQALSTYSLDTFKNWFAQKRIIIFCDSTQSFNFEDSTDSQEIANIIDAEVYTLTINLRSPRSVFERTSQIYSGNYQPSCPRPLESDTFNEIISEDPKNVLKELFEELIHKNAIQKESIVLLYTNKKELGFLNEIARFYGVKLDSSQRFRGLESPVVIVWNGEGSIDEKALFCACTRATSKCIIIYHVYDYYNSQRFSAKYGTFGQLALNNIAEKIQENLWKNLIPTKNITINLYWNVEWMSWVILSRDFDKIREYMWAYHLALTTEHPIFLLNKSIYEITTFDQDLIYFKPVKSLDEISRNTTDKIVFRFCDTCSVAMHTPFLNNSCLIRSSSLPKLPKIKDSEIQKQYKFEKTFLNPDFDPRKYDRTLSIFLIALARWIHKIPVETKQNFVDSITGGSIGTHVSSLLVFTEIFRACEVGRFTIKLDSLGDRSRWGSDDLERIITEKEWRRLITNAIIQWTNRGFLKKRERGVYEIITDPRKE